VPDQGFEFAVELRRALHPGRLRAAPTAGKFEVVAGAVMQAFGIGQQHRGAGFGQARRQRHGVGGAAEERHPGAFALAGHLVGQHADGFAGLQRLEQAAHAGEVGGGQLQVGAAAFLDQGRQPVLLGPPVEHGHRFPPRSTGR
jgi:hypothetical protein